MPDINSTKLAVIGLGYVGLPLAVEFGKIYPTLGFDISESRIKELRSGEDSTLEVEPKELKSAAKLQFCSSIDELQDCNIYIITVPTPIDQYKKPDLSLINMRHEHLILDYRLS